MADAKRPALFLDRCLKARTFGEAVLLDAVATRGEGGPEVSLFFGAGTPFRGLEPGPGAALRDTRSVGGAPLLRAVPAEPERTLRMTVNGKAESISVAEPETHLFEGLNTLLAVRNGESARSTLEWLAYHAEHHGAQAALIIDRARPGEDEGFSEALGEGAGAIAGLERVVRLRFDRPLGKPGLGPEQHPLNAPGAPGKDRMTPPEPDPWRAPLGELLIYEIARARFLSSARAVAALDVHDLLAPGDGPDVFDRAQGASSGCIRLEGRQCYPWRVRKGETPRFGDHICVQFDARKPRYRWCVAPRVAGTETVWRLIRVVGAAPLPEECAPFYRFMALRHPTDAVSAIVPKTSLIEDDTLSLLATGHFGHKPVPMPEEKLDRSAIRPGRTAIVTTMKNEGPFILEWLAYHRAIGVEDFLIYTNDCTDGTDTMLALLERKGHVRHRENPFRQTGLKPQHAALQAADEEDTVRDADWVICMDVDEFLNIHAGNGRLKDLFNAVGDANMIAVTWRLFGNSDIHEYSDRPIIEQFTRCAPELIRKPHQAWGFKTLFRTLGIFKKLGVHRPKGLKPQLWEKIRWVNGSGKPLPRKMFRNGWRSTAETYGYDLVTLNHYAVRSAESFLVKRDRGRVNHVDRDQGLAYWFRMNNNAEEDRSIQRMIPAMREELGRLMADPEIAAAHTHSVACHRARIEELRARPDYAELYADLTGPRLEKLSRMHSHFGANVFLSGPEVIPDEIAARDPSEKFFFTVDKGKTVH